MADRLQALRSVCPLNDLFSEDVCHRRERGWIWLSAWQRYRTMSTVASIYEDKLLSIWIWIAGLKCDRKKYHKLSWPKWTVSTAVLYCCIYELFFTKWRHFWNSISFAQQIQQLFSTEENVFGKLFCKNDPILNTAKAINIYSQNHWENKPLHWTNWQNVSILVQYEGGGGGG